MGPRSPVTASISLTVAHLWTPSDSFCRVTCFSCDIGLELQQPDPGAPHRLLGICPGCQHWFILDLLPDADEAVMVLVPEARDFLRIGSLPDGQEGR
jgi:hypothetical protein